jgi:predicted nucleic acid-binding protein
MWVFDATPLIYLAKVQQLTLVDHLEAPCVIPELVYEEIVTTGLEEGYAGAHDGVAVMDETYGRDVATTEGITTRGTAFLVLKCTKQGAISSDDARTTIDAMIDT